MNIKSQKSNEVVHAHATPCDGCGKRCINEPMDLERAQYCEVCERAWVAKNPIQDKQTMNIKPQKSNKSNKSGQRMFALMYLPSGRFDRARTGEIITVTATTERGAKTKFTRGGSYRDWTYYAFIPYVQRDTADEAQCARYDADEAVRQAADNL